MQHGAPAIWSAASASTGLWNHQCGKRPLGSSCIRSAQCESWVSPEWHRCAGCTELRVGSQPLINWLCVPIIWQYSKIHLRELLSALINASWVHMRKKKWQSSPDQKNANNAWHSSSDVAVSSSHNSKLDWLWWQEQNPVYRYTNMHVLCLWQ